MTIWPLFVPLLEVNLSKSFFCCFFLLFLLMFIIEKDSYLITLLWSLIPPISFAML